MITRILVALALLVVMSRSSLSAEQDRDQELEEANAECEKALEAVKPGKSLYPDIGAYFNFKVFSLLDSKRPEIRRLAAKTLAQLALWGRRFSNALDDRDPRYSLRKHLEKGEDTEVRAGVLAFVLRSDLIFSCPSEPKFREEHDRLIKEVAPILRDLMTAPTPPPHLEALIDPACTFKEYFPEKPEEQAIYIRRVIAGVALFMPKKPGTEFMLRKCYAFAPDVFLSEHTLYMRSVPDVEFRKYTVNQLLPLLVKPMVAEKKKPPEQLIALVDLLAQDWADEVAKGAKAIRASLTNYTPAQ